MVVHFYYHDIVFDCGGKGSFGIAKHYAVLLFSSEGPLV
jgi:hypothetical protein